MVLELVKKLGKITTLCKLTTFIWMLYRVTTKKQRTVLPTIQATRELWLWTSNASNKITHPLNQRSSSCSTSLYKIHPANPWGEVTETCIWWQWDRKWQGWHHGLELIIQHWIFQALTCPNPWNESKPPVRMSSLFLALHYMRHKSEGVEGTRPTHVIVTNHST